MSIDVSASASSLEGDAAEAGFWHVDLAEGVCRMTEAEVEEAFLNRVIGSRTMVLRPGAANWAHYGEVAAFPPEPFPASAPPPPPACPADSDDLLAFDSEPHSYAALEQPYPSVAPMATDVPVGAGAAAPLPWAPRPARFTGAFGPGNHDASELRTRRLIFAGILLCALGGGFFAATGTSGIRALASHVTGHAAEAKAPPAADPLPPAPAAPAASAPTVAESTPPRPLAAPPPTGIASAEAVKPPDGEDAKKSGKKKKKPHK